MLRSFLAHEVMAKLKIYKLNKAPGAIRSLHVCTINILYPFAVGRSGRFAAHWLCLWRSSALQAPRSPWRRYYAQKAETASTKKRCRRQHRRNTAHKPSVSLKATCKGLMCYSIMDISAYCDIIKKNYEKGIPAMELTIISTSSRNIIEAVDIDRPFSDELSLQEEERYSFNAHIKIYKGKTLMGEIYGIVFDEETIENEGEDLQDVADMIDGDVEGAMAHLIKSDIFSKEINGDLIFTPPFDCYIQNYFLYSKDETENEKIAEYLFKNLYDLFLYCYGTHIRCFVTYPAPQHKDEKGNWVSTPDEDESIKNKMIKFHKKMGYSPLGDSGYFAINCVE